jgi:ribosomal protein S18 acetylase RimI-like enzyme
LPALIEILESVALFPSEYLEGMMSDFFTQAASKHQWFTLLVNEQPVALVYFAPETLTEGTYNLYLIAVKSSYQGQGIGSFLLSFVETKIIEIGGRVLIVETSGLPEFEAARRFYEKCGYIKEATIRDFYKDGEDKIVYWKKLNETNMTDTPRHPTATPNGV